MILQMQAVVKQKKTVSGNATKKQRIVKQDTEISYTNEYRFHCAVSSYMTRKYPECKWSSRPQGTDWGSKKGVYLQFKGVKSGLPDIEIFDSRGGYFGAEIELKNPNGKGSLSEGQVEWLNVLRTNAIDLYTAPHRNTMLFL